MPHVTTFRFKALPGRRDAAVAHFEEWAKEQKSHATGFQVYSVIASNDDPDEGMAYVCFDTTENYEKNSNRPAQGAWYQELRRLLRADPEWFNGTIAIAIESVD